MLDFEPQDRSTPRIEFAWIELTNQCNMQCGHCYNMSSPHSTERDLLTTSDYRRALVDLAALNCKQVQFIGGEPTLNKDLPALIEQAKGLGFQHIEVFTNLLSLSDALLSQLKKHDAHLATSFYSHRPEVFDAITKRVGSFERIVTNIKRVVAMGVPLRAGVILMAENAEHLEPTTALLRELGVENIGSDTVREIGRAQTDEAPSMTQLCGSCAGDIVSIGPDGVVSPCNMSKAWSAGSLLDASLRDIVASERLSKIRSDIAEAAPQRVEMVCTPKTCSPYDACCPSTQSCGPCAPNGCSPCYPNG